MAAVDVVVNQLKTNSKAVTTPEEIAQVSQVSDQVRPYHTCTAYIFQSSAYCLRFM